MRVSTNIINKAFNKDLVEPKAMLAILVTCSRISKQTRILKDKKKLIQLNLEHSQIMLFKIHMSNK